MGRLLHFDDQSRKLVACVVIFITTIIGSSGCGEAKKKPDASTMATVSGSVSINGKSVAQESHVIFFNSEKAATAAGKTDALGKFTLKEADPSIGIPAGRYQVMIRPPDPPPLQVGSDDYKKMMTAGAAPVAGGPPKPAERISEIPSKYHDFLTSKIALEVKVGPNTFDIDLGKIAD